MQPTPEEMLIALNDLELDQLQVFKILLDRLSSRSLAEHYIPFIQSKHPELYQQCISLIERRRNLNAFS